MDFLTVPAEVIANLDGLGAVFTQMMTWVGSLITTIASNPLLLLSTGIFAVGGVVGICKRLIG